MKPSLLSILFITILIAAVPYIAQAKLYDIIDDKKFKRIKLKKLHFLFCGIDRQSPKKHGLIKSLFIIQLAGYIVSIMSLILSIILHFVYHVELNYIEQTVLIILGVMSILLVITILFTSLESKKRI